MNENSMFLSVKAISENESFCRSVVAGFCVTLNPNIEEIGDIKTAVSEAVTNCIVHAYHFQKTGKIDISVDINGNEVTITVIDYGAGIANVEEAMQPFFTSGNENERSGMGFTVMQALMDDLVVESTVGVGTKVIMKKTIKREDVKNA